MKILTRKLKAMIICPCVLIVDEMLAAVCQGNGKVGMKEKAAAAAEADVAAPADSFVTLLTVIVIMFQQQSWCKFFATLLLQAAA